MARQRTRASEGSSPPIERGSGSTADKATVLRRLQRVEGQVRGVQRMVAEDAACSDVLTQLAAVIAAARGAGLLILDGHVRGCLAQSAPEESDAALRELTLTIDRFARAVH